MSPGSGFASRHGEFVQAENVRVDAENQSRCVEKAADRLACLHPGWQRRRLILFILLLWIPIRLSKLTGGGQRTGGSRSQRFRCEFQRRQSLGETQEALVLGGWWQLLILQSRGQWGRRRRWWWWFEPAQNDGAPEKAEPVAATGRVGLWPYGGEEERESKETTETQQAAGAVPEDERPRTEPEEEETPEAGKSAKLATLNCLSKTFGRNFILSKIEFSTLLHCQPNY